MGKRTALYNNLSPLIRQFQLEFEGLDGDSVEIYIDVESRKERKNIVEIFREYRYHMVLVYKVILSNKLNKDFYGKEPHDTYAIKFKNKKTNPRIYCLEFKEPGQKRRIVMVFGNKNKPQTKLSKEEKDQLKSIKDYQYEFFKNPKDAIKHREK